MGELIIPKDQEPLEDLTAVVKALLAAPTGMRGLVILDKVERDKDRWNFLFLTKDRLKYQGLSVTRDELNKLTTEALAVQMLQYLRQAFKTLIRSEGKGEQAEIIQ